ncbi:MAG TPA: ABC transporter permease [Gemmatimonadales bacterium]|jgi:peptide/nickel transport system permease protein
MTERAPWWGDRWGAAGLIVLGAFVVLATLAPWVGPAHLVSDVVSMRFLPPISRDAQGVFHALGTDRLGRDVWSRLLYGARVSLAVGGLTMALSLVIGVLVGATAAFASHTVSTMLLGFTDFALGLPRVILLLLLATLWPPSAVQVVLVLGVTGWMSIARLVHGEVRSQLGRPYVAGAAALGVGRARLLLRHIVPHASPPILAAVALGVGNAITLEAGLSFLGLGVQPPTASWGSLIASGRDTVVNAPWVGLAPGVALVLVVVACALVADGLQERTAQES